MPPAITVALSVLNGGKVLESAVRSVVEQSFVDWELLILDDGSTDDAIDKLPFLHDPRIIVVRDGRNIGLSGRLNQAVAMARGRYFARMDHDDLCHPERFARQVEFLDKHPEVDLLATQCATMDENGKPNGALPYATSHEEICARPWLGFPMYHPTWMGRVEWFRKNPYQDPGPYCCEDQELLLRAYRSSHYHTLPAQLLTYRLRTHTAWRKLWRTRKALFAVQAQYFHCQKAMGAIALAFAATVLRVGRDAAREVRYRLLG
ncbi:MAG: glycosyltransferase family 2 protein [Bordetella sp.]|uniref:glycosyltransferase family 2 protein n=1 Tax=Bordetella sp. TaxID=28081 RepID=UPI003F7BD8F2